jgi:hypothetical protein
VKSSRAGWPTSSGTLTLSVTIRGEEIRLATVTFDPNRPLRDVHRAAVPEQPSRSDRVWSRTNLLGQHVSAQEFELASLDSSLHQVERARQINERIDSVAIEDY